MSTCTKRRNKEKEKEKRKKEKKRRIRKSFGQMHKLLERCLAWKGHKHSPQAYLIFRTCKLNRSGTPAFSQSQAGNLFPSSPPVSMEAHPRQNKDTVLFTWEQPSLFICLSYFHSTSTLESRNDADMGMFYCYISKSNQNKQTKTKNSLTGWPSQ